MTDPSSTDDPRIEEMTADQPADLPHEHVYCCQDCDALPTVPGVNIVVDPGPLSMEAARRAFEQDMRVIGELRAQLADANKRIEELETGGQQ